MKGSVEPSPFLRLPREVRDKVYAYLFESPARRRLHIVNPIEQSSIPAQHDVFGLGQGLSLFQTCRLIRSEAAASLYGNNVFVFDDKVFHKPSSRINYETRPTGYCGVALMYTFLQLVGTLNRKSIRHLQIELTDRGYFYHEGERPYVRVRQPCKGKHLGNAFCLLSKGHSLLSLEIRIVHWWKVKEFLRPQGESLLVRKMMKLSGTCSFWISGPAGGTEELPQDLQLMYKELIIHFSRPKQVPSTTLATCTQSSLIKPEGQSMVDHARTAAARYTKLQKHKKDAETGIARWEIMIQQKKESIRPFKAEMKGIDDRFTELKGIVDQFRTGKSLRKRTAEEAAL